jgi:hypothetical protein
MAAALTGFGGYEPPGNFSTLPDAEQRRWLLRCEPFRTWVEQFGEPRGNGRISPYLGRVDPAERERVERVAGRISSPEEVLATRVRMRALHQMLSRLAGVEPVVLNSGQSPDDFPLHKWLRGHVGAWKKGLHPEPTSDLPFILPGELRVWRRLIDEAGRLEDAVGSFFPYPEKGRQSLFAPKSVSAFRTWNRSSERAKKRMGGTNSAAFLPTPRR